MNDRAHAGSLGGRGALTAILLIAFAVSLTGIGWDDGVLNSGGVRPVGQILAAAIQPQLTLDVLSIGARSTWTTLAYAWAGMTLALVIGVPLGIIGSGTVVRSPWARRWNISFARFALAVFRAIHELVWAWLFVAALGLSPMAGVLALGLPYGGILGRIYAELLQDVPDAPLRALRGAGASEWRVFWFGRLPMALPDMLSYTFYRLECGIRSAAILSFVGLGGLGHNIQISLQDIDYSRMWTFVYFLIALVMVVDLWSSLVRRRVAIEQG